MNRREAIKKTGMMLGLATASPLLLHVLQGCTAEKTVNWKPILFNQDQAKLVADIVDQLLPKTDSPSATEVGVDVFIDKMVTEVFPRSAQQTFLSGLDQINRDSQLKNGKLFYDLDQQTKYDFLYGLESNIKHLSYTTGPEDKPFYLMIKELCLLGYFTSEEIMTKHLDYIPIPTKLIGCEPLAANQKLRVGNYL